MCFSMEINSISMLICIGTYRVDIVSFLMSGDTTGIILSWPSSVYRKVKWQVNKNNYYNRKALMK